MHPLYWYSTPALLKQWFDLVLEHGFAYGEGGRALQGKRLLCAISTGGTHAAYQPGGYHDITIGELLAPIRQTARLCGMEFLNPFLVQGAFHITPEELSQAARAYRETITQLAQNERKPLTQEQPTGGDA